MALNLIAAHLVRFKVRAKGGELLLGLAITAIGVLVTWWVIASGHNQSGLQGKPPFSWETLWYGVRGSLFLLAIASGVGMAISNDTTRRLWLLAATIVSAGLGVWASTTMPSPSALRILWQLIQGGLAGLILLVGCAVTFKQRAGIVLLHAGIGLMMFSEFFVGQYAEEGRMSITEGQTVNFLRDIRATELAIIDGSKETTDAVTVIPGSRLAPKKRAFSLGNSASVISDAELPFDVHVEKYIKNSDVFRLDEAGVAWSLRMIGEPMLQQARMMFRPTGDETIGSFLVSKDMISEEQLAEVKTELSRLKSENYATKGVGTDFVAVAVRAAAGTDGGAVDSAAAYVEFREKGGNKSLGKYLVSQWATNRDIAEEIEVDGKKYDVSLRFKREYKPYAMTLKDVRKDDYLGTDTPMNYSSDVLLSEGEQVDGSTLAFDKKVGDFRIWMNNPLRYAGETFYQSSYQADRFGEHTVLQVVTNTGWMMPYVGLHAGRRRYAVSLFRNALAVPDELRQVRGKHSSQQQADVGVRGSRGDRVDAGRLHRWKVPFTHGNEGQHADA